MARYPGGFYSTACYHQYEAPVPWVCLFRDSRIPAANSTDNSSDFSTYLTLSSARINEETQEGGEITYFNISYASLRVMGRVYGTRGACAGIFTYLNDTEESDIEMFTEDPHNYVHYSNQPSSTGAPNWASIPGATVNVSMPGGRQWTDWHIHRLDWTPGRSVFFVDGIQTNTTALQVPSPQPPSGFYLDMWGANSTWVGEMPVGGEAWFDIQWVEMLFNTTVDSSPPPADPKLCAPSVDNTTAATATTAATKPTSTTSWGVRLASMDGISLALWSLLGILMVNY